MKSKEQLPRPEYPRPNFVRNEWTNLNGDWEFAFDDADAGLSQGWFAGEKLIGQITVPFCYQSKASGIGGGYEQHDILWYARSFKASRPAKGNRILLHFGAVDYKAKVWVNGQYMGDHTGGYTPFHFDITDALQKEGDNRLVVRVVDTLSCTQPRGKQNWAGKPFGCWYTPVSGIWQTVWLEAVNESHIKSLRITPDIDAGQVHLELTFSRALENAQLEADIFLPGGKEENKLCRKASAAIQGDSLDLILDIQAQHEVDRVYYWSPKTPYLYDIVLRLCQSGAVCDAVESYFGMRKVDVSNGMIRLNNSPCYQKLILDQGYWPDTLLTPPSDEAIIKDIELTKDMGFNGARKHQKIEDPRYYYWADKLGLLVWGEVPSAYAFCEEEIRNLTTTTQEFIARDYNHPSIICWVPLNESWGTRSICSSPKQQRFALGLYHLVHALDGTRLVSSNDGWEQVDSDICAIHDYRPTPDTLHPRYDDIHTLVSGNDKRVVYADGYKYAGQPVLITEYGGIAFAKDSVGESWGYSFPVADTKEFVERYQTITAGFRALPYVQGYCYTQLTDVFEEVNGLLDMERNFKLPSEDVRKINR